MTWPPTYQSVSWSDEDGNPMAKSNNAGSTVLNASGAVQFSATDGYLNVQFYAPDDSNMTLEITAKTGTNNDTIQAYVSNVSTGAVNTWVPFGQAYIVTSATTLPAAWTFSPKGWNYWGIWITLGTGDTVTYTPYYNLMP